MKQLKKLYIYYTDDIYHLPVAVADSPSELAKMIGMSATTVRSSVSRKINTFGTVELTDREYNELVTGEQQNE